MGWCKPDPEYYGFWTRKNGYPVRTGDLTKDEQPAKVEK